MTPPRFIKVGRIGCVLEPDAVRYIGVAGAELLRRVHVTVRDRAWNTIVPRVEARQEHASDAAIQQNSELHYEHADLAIRVRLHIAVARRAEQTEIDIRLAMTALRDSQVNRAGLCLLLPVADLAGRTARLTRLDLGTTDLVFPSLISAHPLFSDATALEYTLNGSRVQIVFEGERFECEDHRNWGDDSYKVYCGNLRTPRPIRLRAAETIEQRICVTIQPGERRDIANRPAHIVQLGRRINCWPARVSPQRSTCERSADKCFDLTELTIDTTDPASLAPAVPPAGQAWQLVVRTADATSLARLDARFDTASVVIVHRIGAPVTDDALLRAARERFPNATIAGGTAGAFCEINRARARVGSWDAVCFSLSPQVHGMDDLTIAENTAAVGDALRTARQFAPHTRVWLSPTTLARLPDPFAAGNDGRVAPPTIDPRARAPLAAAWWLAILRQAALHGASSITIADPIEQDGRPTPLGTMLARLRSLSAHPAYDLADLDGRWQFGVAFIAQRTTFLLGNLSWQSARLRLSSDREIELPPHSVQILEDQCPAAS